MKNATLTWDLPTTRIDGAALAPADLTGVEVSMSADLGANFSVLNVIAQDVTQELFVPNLEGGDWIFRLVVVDTDGLRSAATDYPFSVPIEPPAVVGNVNVVLS